MRRKRQYNQGYKAALVILICLILLMIPFWLWQQKAKAEAKAEANYEIVLDMNKTIQEKDKQIEDLQNQVATLNGELTKKVSVDKTVLQSPPIKAYTLQKAREAFGDSELEAFEKLINSESGFNLFALNMSSGACGMFQALPCSKLPGLDIKSQVDWGIKYISSRYGSPARAWSFHLANGWY